MHPFLTGAVCFLGASGLVLWWPASWGPGHELLFLLHAGCGVVVLLPFVGHLSEHVRRTVGAVPRLRATAAGLLAAFVFYYLLHGGVLTIGKWLASAALLIAVTPWRVWLPTVVGTFLALRLMNAAAALDPGFLVQAETLNVLLPVWLWIAYATWFYRRSAVRPRGPWTALGRAGLAAAAVATGALLFLGSSGLIVLAGGAAYRAGRSALTLHRWVGFAVTLLTVAHVLTAGRRRPAATLIGPLAGAAALVTLAFVVAPRSDVLPARPERPFTPSALTTASGRPLAAWPPLDGDGCAAAPACHGTVHEQWAASAHRHSTSSPLFRATLDVARAERGDDAVRFCAGCHAPQALLSGGEPATTWPDGDGWRAGITCGACHFAVHAGDGNGALVLSPPRELTYGDGAIGRLLQVAPADRHSRRYLPDTVRTPELCGACHRQVVDAHLNGVGPEVLQDELGSWRDGPFGPDGATPLSCQDCHMARSEPNSYDGAVRDHRMLGGDHLGPTLRGDHEHGARVVAFLGGEAAIPAGEYDPALGRSRDVTNLSDPVPPALAAGPLIELAIDLERHAEASSSGADRGAREDEGPANVEGIADRVRVTLTSRTLGHAFPAGPQDIVEAWVELTPVGDGGVPAGAAIVHRLGARELDGAGRPIREHRIWEVRRTDPSGGFVRPGAPLDLSFPLPRTTTGDLPAALVARLWHRPVARDLAAWALPGHDPTALLLASAEHRLAP